MKKQICNKQPWYNIYRAFEPRLLYEPMPLRLKGAKWYEPKHGVQSFGYVPLVPPAQTAFAGGTQRWLYLNP
jgi:hypothetical protein